MYLTVQRLTSVEFDLSPEMSFWSSIELSGDVLSAEQVSSQVEANTNVSTVMTN